VAQAVTPTFILSEEDSKPARPQFKVIPHSHRESRRVPAASRLPSALD
jgi:hypothetical protein